MGSILDQINKAEDLLHLQTDFFTFFKQSWHVFEPGVPLAINWHHQAIAEHLNALHNGQIQKLLVALPPRHSKPVGENMLILMADGSHKSIKDILPGEYVITHIGRPQKVVAKASQGELPCKKIQTDAGREIIAAYEHPFLTPEGYVQVQNLQVGMSLGALLSPETYSVVSRTDEEFRLAGYFIGDGSTSENNCGFTTADTDTAIDFIECCESLGWDFRVQSPGVRSAKALSYHPKDGAREWLRMAGLFGGSSYTKRVPQWVFQGNKHQIGQFLAAYWMCDGTVSLRNRVDRSQDMLVEICSVAKDLLFDVQSLLLRLGIRSKVKSKPSMYDGKPYMSYRITLNAQDDIARFREYVPLFSYKGDRLKGGKSFRTSFQEKIAADKIVSIEEAGLVPCYCIEVEEDHTYTVQDIICHNSSMISVAFPSWVWITKPQERFVCASYAMSLALRDSQRCRELMDSAWYQGRFASSFTWMPDQNAKQRYENSHRGFRIATSVEGSATGEGGSWIIVDDPHNIQEAESDTMRNAVLSWWDRVMTSRLNDQRTGKMVIIGQRVHEQDLIGHLLETGEWEYLCLPAEYESSRKTMTSIGWEDPRQKDGEVLWEERFPKPVLSNLKKTLGIHYFSQYQQSPVRESGNIFKAMYFFEYSDQGEHYLLHLPDGSKLVPKSHCRTVLSTDLAVSTKSENDFTVFLTWAVTPDLEFLLIDIVHDKMEAPDSEELLWNRAVASKRLWTVILEDVAYQKSTIQRLRRGTPVAQMGNMRLRKGLPITPYKPMTDKVSRAQSVVIWFRSGNFFFNPNIPGFADYKKEMLGFPRAGHDDFVDATTITQALLEFGEPRMTNYFFDEVIQMVQEEVALEMIEQEDPELAVFLSEEYPEEDTRSRPWWDF